MRRLLAPALLVLGLVATHQALADATRGGPLGVPLPLFPAGNWWNLDVSQAPVDPASAGYISFIGSSRGLHPDFGGYAGGQVTLSAPSDEPVTVDYETVDGTASSTP